MAMERNTFMVPEKTNSDFGSGRIYWELFKQVAAWVENNRPMHCLDFGNVVHLKPYAVALSVIVAKRLGVEGMEVGSPRNSDVREHLVRLGVPRVLGVDWGDVAIRDTNIPLEHLIRNPSEGFSYTTAEMLEREFPGGLLPGFTPKIADSIDEVILNVFGHSESQVGCVVVGQAFPNGNRIEATIVDLGITIRGHLSRQYPHLLTDELAIREAVKEGVTGTPPGGVNKLGDPNSGVGLANLREFVEATGGELAILSGSSIVSWGPSGGAQELIGPRFPGTLVNIRFNTAPGNHLQGDPKRLYF